MVTKDEYLTHERFPQLLSLEEINNPNEVIREFFTFNSLPECREELRNWFHAALANQSVSETGNPANLFSFYERVEKLIEAAYVIMEANK